MPVDPTHYQHHGSGNYTVILRCPNIVGNRLVHFDQNRKRGTWVLRDFVMKQQLSNITAAAGVTVAAIEADADHSEPPPYHAVTYDDHWCGYLFLKTMYNFHPNTPTSTAPPNAASGAWVPI
jgi:hypothetical protein